MTTPRPEIAAMTTRRSGYYGLRRFLIIHGAPDWLWRIYWRLQPIRCRFGYHHWYSQAAGECSACECGVFEPWPTWIAQEYRWRPWIKPWAAKVRDAELRAEMAWSFLVPDEDDQE